MSTWWSRARDFGPLDRVTSIKTKFAFVIVVAVGIAAMVSVVGFRLGITVWVRPLIAMAIALVLVRFIANGMTQPLRDMEAAATKMSSGDYSVRVETSAHDEVGRLAEAFNAMAGELENVERMRRDLVANVSHELRTPLSALQAHLENIVDGVEAADPDVLRAMLTQTERLGRMVSQLLDLSRLESGTTPVHRERFEVAGLLREVATECRLHRPDVEVDVRVVPTDLSVDADPERMHQVIANLLDNASRHSPSGAPVEMSARLDVAGVVIEVADHGAGMSQAVSNRVFERFYRSDTARSAEDGGAGLGLAIAQWIVDLHGGDIRAEPREPHGCRMVVVLPG